MTRNIDKGAEIWFHTKSASWIITQHHNKLQLRYVAPYYYVFIVKYTAVSRPIKYNDKYFCIDDPLCSMHRNIEVSFGRKQWILDAVTMCFLF